MLIVSRCIRLSERDAAERCTSCSDISQNVDLNEWPTLKSQNSQHRHTLKSHSLLVTYMSTAELFVRNACRKHSALCLGPDEQQYIKREKWRQIYATGIDFPVTFDKDCVQNF